MTVSALVHRHAEFEAVDRLLTAVRAGNCRGLVVTGGPGSGRTELLGAIADRASASGPVLVVRAQGSRTERDMPWGVLGQLLAGLGGGSPPPMRPENGAARAAALTELVERWHSAAARLPVLLLIDDADDADEESLQALAFLIRRSAVQPIGWVLAVGENTVGVDISALLAAGQGQTVTPEPLCAGCVTAVAESIMGAPLDEDLADVMVLVADGKPGVVKAFSRELAAAGVLPATPDPERVLDVGAQVLARTRLAWLARAHPQAVDLLTAIAVTGDRDPALPGLVLGLGELAAARARAVLHGAGLIAAGPRGGFDRELLRRLVLAGIGIERRAELHLAAAELLARLDGRAEDVAEHLMSVAPTGSTWTVEWLRTAGAKALERGRYDAAARYLQRAVVELSARPDQAPVAALVGQISVVETHRDLVAVARHVEALVAAEPDPQRRAELLLPVLEPAVVADNIALGVFVGAGKCGPVVEIRSGSVAAQTFRRAAGMALVGDSAPLRSIWRSALRGRPGASAAVAAVPGAAALLLSGAGRGLAAVRRQVTAGMAAESADRLAPLLAALWTEDLAGVTTGVTALVDQTHEDHAPARSAAALVLRAEAARRAGRIPAALADAQLALDQAAAVRARGWGNAAAAILVLAFTDAEQHDLARLALARIDPLARPHPLLAGLVRHSAGVQALRRAPDRALGYFLEAGRLLAGVGLDNPACLGWEFGAVAAHLATGQRAAADELAQRTLYRADRWGTPGVRGQALAALAGCQPDGGLRLLHRSAELLSISPLRGELRRVLAATVALAQAGGDDRAAVRAADQVARLGSGRSDLPAAGGEHNRLTASESRVTDLVLQGMSNQEVADTLCLSRRTVDTHLGRIYRKLGIRSRGELAAALRIDLV